jgi:hypothetical protein
MKTFIKVTEIWVPAKNRTHLEFADGLYGSLQAFQAVSEQMRFNYNEGLPGKAWAARHPIILKDFENSYFLRAEAASEAGLTCGIALPVFAGDFLMAVLVFFCGDDEEHVGAIELWRNNPAESYDLGLVDGYFGTAEYFELFSQNMNFRQGFGLPGLVWKTGMPLIMKDLGRSDIFLRRDSALKVGINKGLGIPCLHDPDQVYVVTFLSALGTPIARRFEIWTPNEEGDGLVFHSGDCDKIPDLAAAYKSASLARGEGEIGKVWLTGVPSVNENITTDPTVIGNSARLADLDAIVAMPVVGYGRVRAVIAWYF